MCDIVGQAVHAGVSRRNVLRAAMGGAAALGVAACTGNTGPAAIQPTTAGTPAPAGPPPAVDRVREQVAAMPRLALCGAALDGIGVAACIGSGTEAAVKIIADLGDSQPNDLSLEETA